MSHLKRAILTPLLFFCSLTVSFGSHLEPNQGMWLCTDLKDFYCTRSEAWPCKEIPAPTVKLFIDQKLFYQSAKDLDIEVRSLKDVTTKQAKTIFERAIHLLGGKYTCNKIYLDEKRSTVAQNSNKILGNILVNNNFPIIQDLASDFSPEKRGIQVSLSRYILFPHEQSVGMAALVVIALVGTILLKKN